MIAKNEKDAGDSVSRIYLEQVLGIGFVLVECDATKPAELFSQLLASHQGTSQPKRRKAYTAKFAQSAPRPTSGPLAAGVDSFAPKNK